MTEWRAIGSVAAIAALFGLTAPAVEAGASVDARNGPPPRPEVESPDCELAPHRVQLDGTGRAPGASGWMDLRFGSAPHDVAVLQDGTYRYRVTVQVTSVPPSAGEALVAWAATPDLDQHEKLGVLDEDRRAESEVSWNKFLVFVTAESSGDLDRWRGPILMTGTSPSGNMHTMAGHGIFEQHGIGC